MTFFVGKAVSSRYRKAQKVLIVGAMFRLGVAG